MDFQHEFTAIKLYPNKSCSSHNVSFKSNCDEYSGALLSVISHNKEWHNCVIIEPVTRSPITFDITLKMKSESGSYRSDRYFLTFAELGAFCDTVEKDDQVIEILKQPFTRVLFSQAGKAGVLVNSHKKTDFKKESVKTIFFADQHFNDFSRETFNSIKNGTYYKALKDD